MSTYAEYKFHTASQNSHFIFHLISNAQVFQLLHILSEHSIISPFNSSHYMEHVVENHCDFTYSVFLMTVEHLQHLSAY